MCFHPFHSFNTQSRLKNQKQSRDTYTRLRVLGLLKTLIQGLSVKDYCPEARIYSLTKFGMIDKIKKQKLNDWTYRKNPGLRIIFRLNVIPSISLVYHPIPASKAKTKPRYLYPVEGTRVFARLNFWDDRRKL